MEGEGDVVLDCLAFLVQTPATTNRRKKKRCSTLPGGERRGRGLHNSKPREHDTAITPENKQKKIIQRIQ